MATQKKRTRSATYSDGETMMGSQEPSERISPKYSQTDGGDATRLLAIGGTILDPWQADILDDWMALSPSGRWVATTCGGSVPRQNGKTG